MSDPTTKVLEHLLKAAEEEPCATPRLVNAARVARGHLHDGKGPLRNVEIEERQRLTPVDKSVVESWMGRKL